MIFLVNMAVFLSLMGCIFMYVVKTPVRYKNYRNWLRITLPQGVSFSGIEERVRMMVQTGMLSSAGTAEGLLYFKEKPSMYSWGNSYVVSQDLAKQQCTMYYRGSLIKWRTDRTNLNNMIYILGDTASSDS